MYSHKLELGTPDSRAKWHNPAKDTLYNFHPELDSDIKTTHHSAKIASNSLGFGGKWWNIIKKYNLQSYWAKWFLTKLTMNEMKLECKFIDI